MLRNKIGPVFNARNVVFFGFLFFFFLKNSLLSAGRMRFSKTKEQKKPKKMDQFLTLEKAKIGPVLTLQHICVYIYTEKQHRGKRGLGALQGFMGMSNRHSPSTNSLLIFERIVVRQFMVQSCQVVVVVEDGSRNFLKSPKGDKGS